MRVCGWEYLGCEIITARNQRAISLYSPSLVDVERIITAQETLAESCQAPINRLINLVEWGQYDRIEELHALKAKQIQFAVDASQMKAFEHIFGEFSAGRGFRQDTDGYALDWSLVGPALLRAATYNYVSSPWRFHAMES